MKTKMSASKILGIVVMIVVIIISLFAIFQ